MRSERVDEMLLARYLLGKLAEEEQVRVEDHAFADSEYQAALAAVEADLIDAYVRGQLSSDDRRAFEDRFLISPNRREKVAFARALAQVAEEAKPVRAHVLAPVSGWRSVFGAIRAWNPALQLAAGFAALLCVFGAWWLLDQNSSLRARTQVLEAERRSLDTQQQQLRRELEQQRAQAKAQRPLVSPTSLALLVLSPGISRGRNRSEQLTLTSGTQIARIDIQLEPRDEYPKFRAELRTRRGEEILTRSNLSRKPAGAGFVVSIDLPASALLETDYELTLKGIPASGAPQDIGFYYFTVRRQ